MNPAFLREAMILGPDGLERLQNCHVIVFGIVPRHWYGLELVALPL